MISNLIDNIKTGYSTGTYKNRTYGIEKSEFNGGKSVKIYAKELGGTDFISLNYYATSSASHLKPCEMAEEKVIDFLENVILLPSKE